MATRMVAHTAFPVQYGRNCHHTARQFDVCPSSREFQLACPAGDFKQANPGISGSQLQVSRKLGVHNRGGSRMVQGGKSVTSCPWKGCSVHLIIDVAHKGRGHRLLAGSFTPEGAGERERTQTRFMHLSHPSEATVDSNTHRTQSSQQWAPVTSFGISRKEGSDVGAVLQHENDEKGTVVSTVLANVALKVARAAMAVAVAMSVNSAGPALARPEGVNRPELLPPGRTPIIDTAQFLSPYQEARMKDRLEKLERDTGFRLRVVAQNYPETPGRAVKNYWGVDEYTIVFVADPNTGNILNFNVGSAVDLSVPRSFWSRLAGKYGNIFYWREKGEDAAIEAAVEAIDNCLREPAGPTACSTIQGPA